MENIPLWHERDISHSSVERIILPDISNAVHYSLKRFNSLIAGLQVNRQHMQDNLNITRGLVYSGQALNRISTNTREEAYQIVQNTAFQVINNKEMNFEERIYDIANVRIDSLSYYRHEETILNRVFNL